MLGIDFVVSGVAVGGRDAARISIAAWARWRRRGWLRLKRFAFVVAMPDTECPDCVGVRFARHYFHATHQH